MYIKSNTVIPAGFKITKVAPSVGKAKSLYTLLRAEENRLMKQTATKQRAQQFAAALKVGYTVVEALKLISEK